MHYDTASFPLPLPLPLPLSPSPPLTWFIELVIVQDRLETARNMSRKRQKSEANKTAGARARAAGAVRSTRRGYTTAALHLSAV
eukprot:539082-Hanusia_phi.AAC.1